MNQMILDVLEIKTMIGLKVIRYYNYLYSNFECIILQFLCLFDQLYLKFN